VFSIVCLQPDLTNLQLDDKLEPIFGTKQLPAAALPEALGRLLEPLKPVTVTHTIV
jgi:chromatin remodeling complex protein RSC6